jgi:hypothetical protein
VPPRAFTNLKAAAFGRQRWYLAISVDSRRRAKELYGRLDRAICGNHAQTPYTRFLVRGHQLADRSTDECRAGCFEDDAGQIANSLLNGKIIP